MCTQLIGSMRSFALFSLVTVACLVVFPDRAFAAIRTWDGGAGAVDNNWTNPLNWQPNQVPQAGDSLVFPQLAAPYTANNNFPVGTEFALITLTTGNILKGNRILLADGIRAMKGTVSENANITLDISLKGARTITFDVESRASLILSGVVQGPESATLRKEGGGELALIDDNTYAGATIIAAGELYMVSPAALGAIVKGTTVLPGGMLKIGWDIVTNTFNEPLTLNGDTQASGRTALYIVSSAIWAGPITLQGMAAPIVEMEDLFETFTVSGAISGAQGLRFIGLGTLLLTGVTSNTYLGPTTVMGGWLKMQKTAGLTAVPSGLIVGGGASFARALHLSNAQIGGGVTVAANGELDLNDRNEGIGALTLIGGSVKTGLGLLTLGADVTALQAAQPSRISGRVSLGAASRTFDVQSGASPGLQITAEISSPQQQGLIKQGNGALLLSGPNTYAGLTVIHAGTLRAAHAAALGGIAAGTNLKPHGILNIENDIVGEALFTESEPGGEEPKLVGLGGLAVTWNGPIFIIGRLTTLPVVGSALRLGGMISGPGELRTTGGLVELGAANNYSGDTWADGVLRLTGHQQIPDASRVQVPGILDFNGFNETVGGLWGAGPQVHLGGGTLTVVTKAGNIDLLQSEITGAGALSKLGAGTWVLAGNSTTTAPLTVTAGTVRVTGSLAGAAITLAGGTLQGTGQVGTVTGTNGTLQPGASPGVLHTKSVSIGGNATLSFAINGPAAGTEYAQLDVAGTVTLANPVLTLVMSPGFLAAGAGDLVLVVNDGADPISGTFNGLPEGATIDVGAGRLFRLTYIGGSGNDIVVRPITNRYYLSEGATGQFFDLDILIANPNSDPAPVTITFLREDGQVVDEQRIVPALQRITLRVDDIAGVESTPVSTVVQSDTGAPLIVERTMRWDQSGYGAHTEKAAGGTAATWYFAEGAQGFFSTYLLLANPNDVASTAVVQYLREGTTPVIRSYTVAAGSRLTVSVGDDPELASTSFGMTVTFDQPGIAERSMYFGVDPVWKGGHESAGVTAPSQTWFLAEGATGSFFETFVLIANPNAEETAVTLTFLTSGGAPITRVKNVPANGRLTVNIEAEDPALANAAVSTKISAVLPVIVERAQYWPDPAPQWHEAHNSFGVTSTATKWGLAEGRAGGADEYQTYILIANPGDVAAAVSITFLVEGGAPVVKTFTVPPTSRFNVATGAGTDVPELASRRFGAVLVSDQPVAVERAMYSNAAGQTWAAGTNATATRLP